VPEPGLRRVLEHPRTKAVDNPGRDETEQERDDRNVLELLQELRVGALGVQVLFGFLLSLPFFAVRFSKLSSLQRDLYVADLLLAALATALFSGPVAFHRLVFHRHRKRRLVRVSNAMAIAGLVAVALAITGSVLLVMSYIERGPIGGVIAVSTLFTFACLWFVFPLVCRGQLDR
jgi:hypothetical protein